MNRVDWKTIITTLQAGRNMKVLAEEFTNPEIPWRTLEEYRYQDREPPYQRGEAILAKYRAMGFTEIPRQ